MCQDRNLEIKDLLELNENEYTAYPKLWDTLKMVVRHKFTALNACVRTLERSCTSNLAAHLKARGQREVTNEGGDGKK